MNAVLGVAGGTIAERGLGGALKAHCLVDLRDQVGGASQCGGEEPLTLTLGGRVGPVAVVG
jgi:hypothetical protein